MQASAESVASWLHRLGFPSAWVEYHDAHSGEIICDDGPHCWPLMVDKAIDRGEVTLVDADLHVVNGVRARVVDGKGTAPISIGRDMEEAFWEDVDRRQQQDTPPSDPD